MSAGSQEDDFPPKLVQLTDEQKERIEKNRINAINKLIEKRSCSIQSCKNTEGQPPPSKKAKTAKDLQHMIDLQEVVSEGSIVRIQGTKLIDTGGGFLLEEKDLVEQEEAEKIIVSQPAAYIPSDAPSCQLCHKNFSDSFLLLNYDFPVCDSCRDPDGEHKFITRTDAKNEYLLKDADLDVREPVLRYLTRPNPHNAHWGDMKLYLRPQVEARAIEVWDSLEKIEEQREVREETRVKSKIKKYNKKMESLRKSTRSSLFVRDLSTHVHKWGEESYNEDTDVYSHSCTECGLSESYEKM